MQRWAVGVAVRGVRRAVRGQEPKPRPPRVRERDPDGAPVVELGHRGRASVYTIAPVLPCRCGGALQGRGGSGEPQPRSGGGKRKSSYELPGLARRIAARRLATGRAPYARVGFTRSTPGPKAAEHPRGVAEEERRAELPRAGVRRDVIGERSASAASASSKLSAPIAAARRHSPKPPEPRHRGAREDAVRAALIGSRRARGVGRGAPWES